MVSSWRCTENLQCPPYTTLLNTKSLVVTRIRTISCMQVQLAQSIPL